MIRFSVVKIGDKLGGRRNQTGKIEELPEGSMADWAGRDTEREGAMGERIGMDFRAPISDLD